MEESNTLTANDLLEARQDALNRITARLVLVIIAPLVLMLVLAYGLLAREGQQHTYLMLFAFLTGVLGGFVSVQQRLPKATLIELQALSHSWTSLFMMPVTGGVFALVLYIMFTSEIVTGALFPAFSHPVFSTGAGDIVANVRSAVFETAPKTAQDLSKLIFWAFVAGFMERFVPRLIRINASGAEMAAEKVVVRTVEASPRGAAPEVDDKSTRRGVDVPLLDKARVEGMPGVDQSSRTRRSTP